MNSYKNNDTILAGFSVRALAYIIDLLIVLAMQAAISLVLLIVNIFTDGILYQPLLFKYSASSIILYIAGAVYFIFTTYSSGATVGKNLMKIKVVNKDAEPLNFIDILYRETIGRYLSSIFYVGYLMVAGSKDNAALHDKLCNTRVIYTNDAFKAVPASEAPAEKTVTEEKKGFELEAYAQLQEEQNAEVTAPQENNKTKAEEVFKAEKTEINITETNKNSDENL